MWNIFIALMTITLAFAFFDPNFFVAYLISIAVFGLFQAIYMANAGGSWDNAKKLRRSRSARKRAPPLHAATVVGDTVGDPFKDTTSVALNPIIKFSTLFGLLAVEIAVEMKEAAHADGTTDYTPYVGVVMLLVALIFVWRSFYAMRIPVRTNPGGATSRGRRRSDRGSCGVPAMLPASELRRQRCAVCWRRLILAQSPPRSPRCCRCTRCR